MLMQVQTDGPCPSAGSLVSARSLPSALRQPPQQAGMVSAGIRLVFLSFPSRVMTERTGFMDHQGLLIRGARVVDPSQKLDARRDLYLLGGKVAGHWGKSVRYSARRHTGAGCGRPDSGAGAGGHACPLSGSGPDPQGGHPHRQQSGGGRRRHLSGLYAEHPARL